MGPWRKPKYVSQTVVTRPAVSSSIFNAASREAAKRDPLPRNTARWKSAAAILASASNFERINSPAIWLSFSHSVRYSFPFSSIPRKRTASSRLLKLLVITRLLSSVSLGSVMTRTFLVSCQALANLPCSLHVTTTCRICDSVPNNNSTTPLLSGLSPDLATETSTPGLPRGSALPPYINKAPPLIDSVGMPSEFCKGKRTHSAAYSELPEPVSARLRIPFRSSFRASHEASIRSQVRNQVQGCWQISRIVWK